jgi:hypothetical protein
LTLPNSISLNMMLRWLPLPFLLQSFNFMNSADPTTGRCI